MAYFVIQRSLEPFKGPYVSKDGRECVMVKNAKQFKTQQEAQLFLDSPDLGTHVYLSPTDHKNKIWQQWRVRKVVVSYDVSDC